MGAREYNKIPYYIRVNIEHYRMIAKEFKKVINGVPDTTEGGGQVFQAMCSKYRNELLDENVQKYLLMFGNMEEKTLKTIINYCKTNAGFTQEMIEGVIIE